MSLVPFIQYVAAPLVAAVDTLAPALAAADHRPFVPGNSISASFAVSAGFIACLSIILATWMRARLGFIKRSLRDERARSRTEVAFLEMLLGSGPQGLVVMRGDGQERLHFGNGRLYYDRLLDGPLAPRLVKALDGLKEDGENFELALQDKSDSAILVRGTAVAGRAVVYLCEQEVSRDQRKYGEILDALPVPVWTRNDKMALDWANAAFLRAAGVATLGDAQSSNAALDKAEAASAANVFQKGEVITGQASAALCRRAQDFRAQPCSGGRSPGGGRGGGYDRPDRSRNRNAAGAGCACRHDRSSSLCHRRVRRRPQAFAPQSRLYRDVGPVRCVAGWGAVL